MKVSMIGLGKLGLPVALAMEHAGHEVYGYDANHSKLSMYARGEFSAQEVGPHGTGELVQYLRGSRLKDNLYHGLDTVVEHAEIIFVAVQTPHDKEYEGITRMPDERHDFDYSYLEGVINMLARIINKPTPVCVISTVLPGTTRQRILPLANEHMKIVYNPSFIAMGTTMQDWLNPEFVLAGTETGVIDDAVIRFYVDTGLQNKIISVTFEEAELAKVAYNTFISMKIVFANTLMEIAHRTKECYVDNVSYILSRATNRLVSPRYLQGGMGDGGACHPRDLIAMSYLAQKLNLSHDIFTDLVRARENQAEWLVSLMEGYDLPKVILGTAFKANSKIRTGSPALLCKSILEERGHHVVTYDPVVGEITGVTWDPAVFLIGADHDIWEDFHFPKGSVVIDPWRRVEYRDGIKVIRVGKS